MLKALWNLIGTLFYPETCCSCGKLGSYLCDRCSLKVDFLFTPIQLPAHSALTSLTVGFHYKPPISELIQAMKYQSAKGVAQLLGEALYLHTNYPEAELVTSVPLLKEKEGLRGYNQAREIGQTFAKHAKITYKELLQKHSHHSRSQASLADRDLRLKNVSSHAFTMLPRVRAPTSVLIVDDVFTTGATLNACAKPLKEAGAREVHGLVVAHGQ